MRFMRQVGEYSHIGEITTSKFTKNNMSDDASVCDTPQFDEGSTPQSNEDHMVCGRPVLACCTIGTRHGAS